MDQAADTGPQGSTRGNRRSATTLLAGFAMPASAAIWVAILPLLYVGWALTLGGFLSAFELNPDEGVNLIKAALLFQGHPLYSSIWSDQPPLLTHTLRGVIAICGYSVAAPRLLMLLASSALVWGIGRHLHKDRGIVPALAAQSLILAQPAFYLFSAAIMVGLPAIYLAFGAAFAVIHTMETQQPRWFVGSAMLLAASLMTKLFTIVVVPVVILFLVLKAPPQGCAGWMSRWRGAALWTLMLVTSLGALFLLLVGWEDGSQLVIGHARALGTQAAGGWAQHTLRLHLSRLPWLIAPALLGAGFALYQRDPVRLFFVGWSATAAMLLSLHHPVWMHHQFLVTLPAALVGGFGIGELFAHLTRRTQLGPLTTWLGRAAAVGVGMAFIATMQQRDWQAPERQAFDFKSTDPAVTGLLRDMTLHAGDDGLVITDRPMLVYRAGLSAPAWIAALTEKRMVTGQLSEDDIISEVRNFAPPQVVLARFELPQVRDFLNRTYRLLPRQGMGALYLRGESSMPSADSPTRSEWKVALHRPASWYANGEARRMAAMVLQTQGPNGGWPKGRPTEDATTGAAHSKDDNDETLDNLSTTAQLRFLVRMLAIEEEPTYRQAVQRGVDYLLRSQHPIGCWPQSYPHLFSYHAHCTLNDGVTVNAARFLLRVGRQEPSTRGLVDPPRMERSTQAAMRSIAFLIRAQVRIAGQRTGWCQQYDPLTLQPRPARRFEPVALASRESAEVLRFLMQQPNPSDELKATIHAGVAWLREVQITGVRIEDHPDESLPHGRDRIAVPDPQAPPLWARHYSIDSQQPIFVGRDGLQRANFNDIEPERRAGYDFLVSDPATILSNDYPEWCRGYDAHPGNERRADAPAHD